MHSKMTHTSEGPNFSSIVPPATLAIKFPWVKTAP